MNPIDKTIRRQQQRDSRQQGIESVAAGFVLLSGEFRFVGAGEGIVEVNFPDKFWEKPITTFGLEYHSDKVNDIPTTLADGGYPEVTLFVASYKVDSSSAQRILYTGMFVAVKTTGTINQKLTIAWHAHGLAYTGGVL